MRLLRRILPPLLLLIVPLVVAKDLNVLSSPRIIGGNASSRGRYPYMASMAHFGAHQCGGTLVAPDIVMTAAHCVGFFNEVQVGRYILSEDKNDHEVYLIQEIARHPRYYPNAPAEDDPYDIALIKLYGESQVQPVRLNRDPAIPTSAGDELVIAGWGTMTRLDGSSVADTLQEATVEYIPNEECSTITGNINGVLVSLEGLIIDVTLCASDVANGQDTCNGDSGGPILITGKDASEDAQVGITSSGNDGCASKIFPGIYARTSETMDWIDENICRLSSKPPLDFGCPDVPRLPEKSEDEIVVMIEIDYGVFPNELGWIVQSTNNYGVNVTYASRPIFTYSNFNISSTLSERITLPNNQEYTFILLDQRENGICCGLGGLRIYQGPSFAEAVDVYVDGGSDSLPTYAILPFEFVIGGLSTTAPTVTPAPSITFMPSSAPTVTRPFLLIEIIFDDYSEETGWSVEALVDDDEEVLIDVRYSGSYSKYKRGDRVVEQVNLQSMDDSSSAVPAQYRFTVTDNEGDGLCCDFGVGIVRVYAGGATTATTTTEEMLLFESTQFILEQEFLFSNDDLVIRAPTTVASSSPTNAPPDTAPRTPAPTPKEIIPPSRMPVDLSPVSLAHWRGAAVSLSMALPFVAMCTILLS